ncbi:TlpA disulfide reductase family protein [Actimicrobium sp. CCC2.4]|uniref:TlpA family protein disulfide reductase n=1 Tax=Actimicrobium sp. CCC2.4 TaxID=3048606 RepID=UPI002AC8DBD0|nr:TlpA disulfide reductase family protein [Actimicrobium sp. CCC2.4]MEB0134163.1 TlpA disulfide reductase family protein [Actimicrobium sp. CCC2.4]WPX32817.1 TlpA disulfide reductase family protein [Actimicrobium sp. CCC2.4]
MNKRFPHAALLMSTMMLALTIHLPVQAAEVGHPAPHFELPGRAGAIRLDAYKGKVVYLDFWASWCGPCKQSFPWMNTMQERYREQGLRVVAINVDQKNDDANSFLKDNRASFDIAFDPAGKTPLVYDNKGMPGSVLIGPDGKILLVHRGFRQQERAGLEHQIQLALAAAGNAR